MSFDHDLMIAEQARFAGPGYCERCGNWLTDEEIASWERDEDAAMVLPGSRYCDTCSDPDQVDAE